jgi:hypothetical protein
VGTSDGQGVCILATSRRVRHVKLLEGVSVKKCGFLEVVAEKDYSIPHFLVIFTRRKITKATIMKVINATKKSPTPNNCPV